MVKLKKQNYAKNKKLYLLIQQKLQDIFGKNVCVEHVGSTAIPNMYGKNIIDVLLGVDSSVQLDEFAKVLEQNGYFGSQKSKTDIYQFFASSQSETGDGDVHIHLVVIGTDRYNEFVILRDYLLANPTKAQAYSDHKKQIINLISTDRAMYREIKSKYVSQLIYQAKQSFNKL